MSNGQGQGGGKPPYDDRTLLDPLSNDELRALREARQRMQAKKEPGSAVAHQIVIGPDTGEDIGDAPTRAMPALPSFDTNVSLDMIAPPSSGTPHQRVTGAAVDPASRPSGPTPSSPMSVLSQADTVAPTMPPSGRPAGVPPPSAGNDTAAPGFGENTLLWMQPPKMPTSGQVPISPGTFDFIPRPDPREVAIGRIKTYGAVAVAVLLATSLLYLGLFSSEKGVLELHSTPPKAEVFIDGSRYEATPVKLTLSEGSYRISLKLPGFETAWFTANVEPEQVGRRDVTLTPISQPGMMTVKIEVQPVAAKITVDGKAYAPTRVLMVPNLDPLRSHKIVVEAVGFVKIIQDIRADELKRGYSFALAKSSE